MKKENILNKIEQAKIETLEDCWNEMDTMTSEGMSFEEVLRGWRKRLDILKSPSMSEKMDTSKVNRVEVIDHTKPVEEGGGRAFVFWEDTANVELYLQDDGRTLKVFIRP